MDLTTERIKDKLKLRKHRVINANLKETHVADFGKLAFKSLFDANKHKRTINTENKQNITIGILKNLDTKKVVWILTTQNENSDLLEYLILTAIQQKEKIKVLLIDNNQFTKKVRKHNIKPKIITKSIEKPYNSYAEQEISRIQKAIQRNYEKIKELSQQTNIETVIKAICNCVFDNNPKSLLKLLRKTACRTEKINIVTLRNP